MIGINRLLMIVLAIMAMAAVLMFMCCLVMIPSNVQSEDQTVSYLTEYGWEDVDFENIRTYPEGSFRNNLFLLNSYYFVTPDDPVVCKLFETIQPTLEGKSDYDKAEWLLSFVHYNIDYENDIQNHGKEEYMQFASETALSQKGDCEDYSILYYNLCLKADIDVAFVFTNHHVGVAVDVDGIGERIRLGLSEREYILADPTNENRIGIWNYSYNKIALKPSIIPISAILLLILILELYAISLMRGSQ